jgi:hypothetical protein
LSEVAAGGGFGWPDDQSPYPGLRSFNADDHRVFFGRSADIKRLVVELRSPASRVEGSITLVVGPSGCGKSSLVRAGLLPTLAKDADWRVLQPIKPGAAPIAALSRELASTASEVGLQWTIEDTRRQLETRGLSELADELLVALPSPRRPRMLVVIDQFEELLTLSPVVERAKFAKIVEPSHGSSVLVLGTIRSEFLDQLLTQWPCFRLSTGRCRVGGSGSVVGG